MAHHWASSPSTPTAAVTISSSSNLFHHQSIRSPPPLFPAPLPSRGRSVPMSMPNAQTQSPPPPLPPPRHVEEFSEGQDPTLHFSDRENGTNSAPLKPGSSLLGGAPSKSPKVYTGPEKSVDLVRPASASDEVAKGKSSPQLQIPDLQALLEYNKLQSEKELGQRALEKSSQDYDKGLLSRIGGPRTPPRSAGGQSAGGANNENSPGKSEDGAKKGLRPLSMPERRHSDFETVHSAKWPGGGSGGAPSAAVSPGFSTLRSPLSDHGMDRFSSTSHRRTSTLTTPADEHAQMPGRLARTSSYDHQSVFGPPDQDLSRAERPGMPDASTHERSPSGSEDQPNSRTGQKRRAQSPPGDAAVDPRLGGNSGSNNNNNNNGGGGNESWARPAQVAGGRTPQAPKYQPNPNSLSSSAASSVPRNGSYSSSYGMSNASTATSYSSERNFSPAEFHQQQQQQPEVGGASSPRSSYPPLHSTNHHPPAPQMQYAGPSAMPPMPHRRTTSSGVQRAPGLWICDCCPKKPKKFESEEELRVHEMEKQYICQYCHNRFKNKNEAERHQNSLHLRRHSWSCAALTSFEAAFHPTPTNTIAASLHPHNYNNPNYPHHPQQPHTSPTDTCGYCGMEFANPPDWNARVEHLNHVHKFGECNQSKKFYRADHFRQHLKHSHAGTSGKWTNMLENACMKDEPPPPPLGHGIPGITMIGAMTGQPGAPMAAMMAGMQAPPHHGHGPVGYGQAQPMSEIREDQ